MTALHRWCRKFYERGPARRIALPSSCFCTQIAAGKLSIGDPELAAAQFMHACQSTLFEPMIFNAVLPPGEEQIAHVAPTAMRGFLAACKA